ncbi:hypothetical protein GCM10009845_38860 [Pedococcus bigeumensis]|jgi:hypothetical protein
MGSGAEIGRKPIATAAGERVEAEDNQAIWARWNASSPAVQAAEFVKHDAAYLDTIEALSAEQRWLDDRLGLPSRAGPAVGRAGHAAQ